MLTRRRITAEHMDDPSASREDQVIALRFLRRANARLGGAKAAIGHLKRWAPDWPRATTPAAAMPSPQPSSEGRGRTMQILDVGTGSADIPVAMVKWARRSGHRVHITAVDRHPVTVDLAREFVRQHGMENDITIVQGDALRLAQTFEPQSFDYAHAGLFLHHLQDMEVVTVLRTMDSLTRRGVIWNDLVRVRFPRLMMFPILIGAPPKLKHDAIVSVQAAFTKSEAFDLARLAGWHAPQYRRHLVHRFTLVNTKDADV